MRSRSTLDEAPLGNFVAFLMMLGWEGPAAVCIGVRDSDLLVTTIGAFITLAFWTFGWPLGVTCFKHLTGIGTDRKK